MPVGYDLSDRIRESKQPFQVLHFTCHSYCFEVYGPRKVTGLRLLESSCIPDPLLLHALQSLGCLDVTYLISAVYKWYKYKKNLKEKNSRGTKAEGRD